MAKLNKIDSNQTGLAYTEEDSLGVTGSNTWYELKPNSYADFGGNLTTVAPDPINSSRSREFGVAVDVDAAGGFNHNMDFFSLRDILQGVFYADTRAKGRQTSTAVVLSGGSNDEYQVASTTGFLVGSLVKGAGFTDSANNGVNEVLAVTTDTDIQVAEGTLVADGSPATGNEVIVVGFVGEAGDLDVDASGDLPIITSSSLDFTTLELVPGQWIFIGNGTTGEEFANAENNGFARVRSVTANALTLDKSVQTMVTETSATETVHIYFGDVLRNEDKDLQRRRTYTVERLLGAPESSASSDFQSEHLLGALANTLTIEIPIANLINWDIGFLATNHVIRDTTANGEGIIQSNVQSLGESSVFNTSSDFSRIKMTVVDSTNSNPTPLFGFVTSITLNINNNASLNKAIGTFGAFEVTAGNFQVTGSVNAYFSDVAAMKAVRSNERVTLDMAMVKDNQGIVIDIPLMALGDGRASVEKDQPITLPMNMDAATASIVDSGLDHTLLFSYFDYLPEAAE